MDDESWPARPADRVVAATSDPLQPDALSRWIGPRTARRRGGLSDAAIHASLARRDAGRRLAPWATRLAQLASGPLDRYDVKEAAQLVELACRWVFEHTAP